MEYITLANTQMALVGFAFLYLLFASSKFRKSLFAFIATIGLLIWGFRGIIIFIICVGWLGPYVLNHSKPSAEYARIKQNSIQPTRQQTYSAPVNVKYEKPSCEKQYPGNEMLITQCNFQRKNER